MSDDHAQGGGTGGASDNEGTPAPGGAPENAGGSTGIKVGGAPAGSGDAGGDAGNSDWLASLSDENKQVATQRGWKSADDPIKSYRELETKFSSRDTSKDTSPKGGEYRPGDYVFNKPQNADAIGYNEDFATQFKGWVSEGKVDPKTASFLHDKFVEFAGSSIGQQQEHAQSALTETLRSVETSLTKQWGAPNTPGFQRNVQLAERAASKLGIMDALKGAGVFVQNGKDTTVANAEIFAALAKVGNAMYAEDELHGAGTDGVNPFEKDGNERAISELVRNDPAKALMLINQLPPAERNKYANTMNGLKRKLGQMA